MIPRAALAATALALSAACNPAQLADTASQRAARAVVLPVLAQELPAPQAEAAADCLLSAASPAEQRALAADIGVRPGTRTLANIRALALRPAAATCLARAGLPGLKGGA